MTSVQQSARTTTSSRPPAPLVCPCRNPPPPPPPLPSVVLSSGNTTPNNNSNTVAPPCKVLCENCVAFRLEKIRERRRRILQERNQERQACQDLLEQSPLGPLVDLQNQVQVQREHAERLRRACAQRAIDVARQSCANDERRQEMEAAQRALIFRPFLQRLQSSLLDGGSLELALEQGRQQVRLLRFEWAKRAFIMHRLDVIIPPETNNTTGGKSRPKIAKGIGKIGGLPLPHAGAELYGVLPPQELESALRLVASVTSLVASCLGIVLPHPILLLAPSSASSTTSHDLAQDTTLAFQAPPEPKNTITSETTSSSAMPSSLAASTASLASLVGQTAKKVWGGATSATAAKSRKNPLLLQDTAHTMVIPPSMESSVVQERILHASAAILAEDTSANSSRYSLSAKVMAEDQYAIALQLLQDDVVVLCIRAGVPVAKLWPAQAILLNLQALFEFCREQSQGV